MSRPSRWSARPIPSWARCPWRTSCSAASRTSADIDTDMAAQVTARLRDHLGAALVRSKRPVSLNVVRALPAGATGKVQRRALRESDIPVVYRLDCR